MSHMERYLDDVRGLEVAAVVDCANLHCVESHQQNDAIF